MRKQRQNTKRQNTNQLIFVLFCLFKATKMFPSTKLGPNKKVTNTHMSALLDWGGVQNHSWQQEIDQQPSSINIHMNSTEITTNK